MIIKSYEVNKKKLDLLKSNFFLFYGENVGLKKDIKNLITAEIKKNNNDVEILSLYESEILSNEKNFFNLISTGSLFSQKKIIAIYESTDKITKLISDALEDYSKDIFLIIVSNILEKKSKLRNIFEKNKKTICIACYLDNEKDLETITQLELKKNNIILSREIINLLIEKSNFDRNNLRNEIEKIKSYSLNKKKIEIDEIKSLINFSGEHKSDNLINECLSGNILQYKKIIADLYINTINHILLLRILSSKIHRLLRIKSQADKETNIEVLINTSKPPVFWKEKPLIKKQLKLWSLEELQKMVISINDTEILCKKNPKISNSIFLHFFSDVCKKASNYS
jgi:DNA polymerase-3 subunit delta|tara:strand:+ start:262 stop:1281 length:1020 start_codon:yes stop_codon:yes gene_type:complete